jgi:hypothetical protein
MKAAMAKSVINIGDSGGAKRKWKAEMAKTGVINLRS